MGFALFSGSQGLADEPREFSVDWPAPSPLSDEEKRRLDSLVSPATTESRITQVPNNQDMRQRLSATGTYFGLPYEGDMEEGYAAVFRGEIDKALELLRDGQKRAGAWSDFMMFRLTGIEADLLIRVNRAADADAALRKTAYFEDEVWGKTWIASTRRGEAQARLNETANAEGDLGRVALELGSWQMPTTFTSMPNITDLSMRSEAKFRSHMGLASHYTRAGDYARGLAWASSTERHFQDLFELAAHPMFGPHVPIVPDFYLGRGENLAYFGASLLVVTRDPQKAEPYFQASAGFFRSIGFDAGATITEAFKAQALFDAGFNEQFLETSQQASALAIKAGLHEIVWRIETRRGKLLLEKGRIDDARQALRRAQASVELVTGALSSDRARLRFGVGKEDVTRLLVEIDIAKKDMAALFVDLERGRARAFVDMLAGRQIATGRQPELVAAIDEINKAIRQQRVASNSGGVDSKAAMMREEALLERWRELNDQLRAKDPELAAALSVAHQDLASVQKKLRKGQVMAYVLPSEKTAIQKVLLVNAASAEVVSLKASRAEIQTVIEEFGAAVLPGETAKQERAAKQLNQMLDLAAWSKGGTLFVVPSGPFYFIPWGALNISIPVVMLPTGGWLARKPEGVVDSKNVSVVGDPKFFNEMIQLPGAREEAKRIAKLYKAEPLLGEQATEDNLRQSVGDGVAVLHLATHGFFDAEKPLNSALILSGQGKADFLTAARVFETPLPAKLVILSACETGVGKAVAGDDFLGLARSFYLGGSLSVLHSLWPITDAGTLAYMEIFHSVSAGGDYGQAWLAARNQLKKSGYPPSVYGAFVLGGASKG